ncbi:hypothetical protein [Nocardia sp. NPDC050413]|uniref:hypothetical protein n=1 Tax=Nocardia sp. NPDC050413 TaxID=3155784 RepID=UPI0033E07889
MTSPQDERWTGELVAVLSKRIVVYTDSMPLPVAAEELLAWLRDLRVFQRIQHRDWKSVIAEYGESFRTSGPRLCALLQSEHRALKSCLDQLFTMTGNQPILDEHVRSAATTAAEKLLSTLSSDRAVIAAWKDMAKEAQCTVRHTDCLESRRQCWSAIIEMRRQGSDDVARLCAQILTGDESAIRYQLGRLRETQKHDLAIDGSGPLRPFQKAALCESVLTEPPKKGDCVVWLRVDGAQMRRMEVSHGGVTFYAAQLLGPVVGSVDTSPALKLRPSELAAPTKSPITGDVITWDDDPGIVYVRVALNSVEFHLAVTQARAIAATLIQLADPLPGTWKLLVGEIVYVDGKLWYQKRWRPEGLPLHRERHLVDDIGQRLEEIGSTTTFADIAGVEKVEVALALRSALATSLEVGPVEVVMAAVRALEHATAWAGGDDWTTFLRSKFRYAVSHVQLVEFVTAVMGAIDANAPSNDPFAPLPETLLRLTCELYEWNGDEDELVPLAAIGHAAAIRDIYAEHWLYRSLAEVAAVFESGTKLKQGLEASDRRFDHYLDRLRRVRNSAIHGGPITTGTCDTIAHFAFHLGRYCLEQILRAHLAGENVQNYLDDFTNDHARRREVAITHQSYEQLFTAQ